MGQNSQTIVLVSKGKGQGKLSWCLEQKTPAQKQQIKISCNAKRQQILQELKQNQVLSVHGWKVKTRTNPNDQHTAKTKRFEVILFWYF